MRALLYFLCLMMNIDALAQLNSFYMFVGTYTNETKTNGVHVYRFFSESGEVEPVSVVTDIHNPSYLAISKDGGHVYAVSEAGGGSGALYAYAFDRNTGTLTFLNKAASRGDHPCYVSVNDQKTLVFVGNYGGGNLAAFAVDNDGSLMGAGQAVDHDGRSVDPQRQEKPHVHAVVLSPDNHFLFVPDLGTDKINIYSVDAGATSLLKPTSTPFVSLPGGSGPRHLVFHPDGKNAYLVNELNGTITAFKYRDGKLQPFQTISMLDEGFTGVVGAADIHVSPDGKFLYASNRGDANDISTYSIRKNGKLSFVARQSTLGKTPRNFVIDPTGRYLLVANQQSNDIFVFERDFTTGLLTYTGKKINIDKPVCLKFLPR